MYISCNQLKKYIKDSDKINWHEVWKIFTIRSAEIDGVETRGEDIKNVVVGKITSLEKHPTKEKYSVAKIDVGDKEITLISSATNLYEGMLVPCALPGGSLKGLEKVGTVEFQGVNSEGVLASEKELGISDKHLGVMDLGKDVSVDLKPGTDIKSIMPIDDIIIEIDNKSLTNRPDMWGQYGIAREVAAITGHELLPLDLYEDVNGGKELEIKVLDTVNCNRYSGIKIENITEKETDIEKKIMLYYCGMRSISLLVDLSNYLMLELGQPMHTFDAEKINNIVVKNVGTEHIKFTTLDGVERNIAENTLMICDGDTPVAIAGVMGGLNSEIDDNSTSVVLESANFDAASVRKSATAVGLRTEASARYEKSLDPNMTDVAIKRFVKLLKDNDNGIKIASKLTDVYCNKVVESVVTLKKSYLKKFLGFDMEPAKVKEILTSLTFKVEEKADEYVVTAPTFRSTKDISNQSDIVEEISRMYGYENFTPEPLKLDLVAPKGAGKFELEYSLKKAIADLTRFSEIHTYLWYQSDLLNTFKMDKSANLTVVNKAQNNILRDDLSWSMYEQCLLNSKYYNEYGIFEIGTVMRGEDEDRVLSIVNVCPTAKLADNYQALKNNVYTILRKQKGIKVTFEKGEVDKQYLNNAYTLNIKNGNDVIGYISIFDNSYTKECGKKTSIINCEVYVEKLLTIEKEYELYKEPSKYQNVTLDFTVIMEKTENYAELEEKLKEFKKDILVNCKLIDIYMDDKKKVTIRFTIGSNERTLEQAEIQEFKDDFISFIEKTYSIVK